MAKFYGTIGFVETEEGKAGVHEEVVTEHSYVGDIVRSSRRWEDGPKVNSDLTIENRISIIADSFAIDNTPNMRYVTVFGSRWKINSVEIARPRIILSVSGLYNGPIYVEPEEEV